MEEEQVLTPEEGDETEEVTEAEETPEETPGEEEATEVGETEQEVEPEPEPEKEPTVAELAKRLEKAEKRTQYLQRKLERPGKAPETVKPAGTKPRPEDYEDYDAYVDALTDFKADERDRTRAEERNERQQKEKAEDFRAVIDTGPEKYPDFNEVVMRAPKDGGPTITENMLEAMTDCENVVDIAYHLAQNIEESQRIAAMTPIQAAREIGKLDAKLSGGGGKTLPQKTKTKKITPQKPITGKTVPDSSLSDMSTDDFMKSRNQVDGVA